MWLESLQGKSNLFAKGRRRYKIAAAARCEGDTETAGAPHTGAGAGGDAGCCARGVSTDGESVAGGFSTGGSFRVCDYRINSQRVWARGREFHQNTL